MITREYEQPHNTRTHTVGFTQQYYIQGYTACLYIFSEIFIVFCLFSLLE